MQSASHFPSPMLQADMKRWYALLVIPAACLFYVSPFFAISVGVLLYGFWYAFTGRAIETPEQEAKRMALTEARTAKELARLSDPKRKANELFQQELDDERKMEDEHNLEAIHAEEYREDHR